MGATGRSRGVCRWNGNGNDDAWTVVCVVGDPPHALRHEIEHFRDFGIHALGDDFKVPRQVREEVLLSQSGHGQR